MSAIRARDASCVYCGKQFNKANAADHATVEHLNHKKDWDSVGDYLREGKPVSEIVAMCCRGCNSSRSDKSLLDWFNGDYCEKNGITYDSVAPVIRNYIDKFEK